MELIITIAVFVLLALLGFLWLFFRQRKQKRYSSLLEQKLSIYQKQKEINQRITRTESNSVTDGATFEEISEDIYKFLNKEFGPFSRLSIINVNGSGKDEVVSLFSTTKSVYQSGTLLDVSTFSGFHNFSIGKKNIINDISSIPSPSESDKLKMQEGIKSYVSFPMMHEGKLIGLFNLSSQKKSHFTPDIIDQITELVSSLSVSFQQAKEYYTLQNDLDKLTKKNQKSWQMSLAVHKQKEEVEERARLIAEENVKIEKEKDKIKARNTKLWEASLSIHKDKERIEKLKVDIEEKHKSITDSIEYAKRIQDAIMPSFEMFKRNFSDSFLYFRPRDIVSGDFYWAYETDDKFIWTAADCTGHGVPGAFMSMIGISLLNKTVIEFGITDPAEILDNVRSGIVSALSQKDKNSDQQQKDGMDICLCVLDKRKRELSFSAANNSLFLIRDNELIEHKAQKQPVGFYHHYDPFLSQVIQLKQNDVIVTYTDGFQDQFGGEHGKKLKSKLFKEILLKNQNLPMSEQLENLDREFVNWKGKVEQIDDVCVIGVRV